MKPIVISFAAASLLAACSASDTADVTFIDSAADNVDAEADDRAVDTTITAVDPPTTSPTSVPSDASEGELDSAVWALRSPTMDAAATSIPVLVLERACTSASSAEGRIVADVAETDTEVEITIGVVPLDGDQQCEGGPATPFTVELGAPLGDRRIVGDADPDAVSSELPVVRVGTVDPSLPAVDVISSRDTAGPSWNDFSCVITGADEFYVEAALPEPTDVLEFAAAARGYRTTGWHEFRQLARNQFGSDEIIYAQFVDGVAVTAVFVSGSTTEWIGRAAGCNDLPSEWTPDVEAPADAGRVDRGLEEFRFADPLDLTAVADATRGLSITSPEAWAFDDPDAPRCPVWIAFEDAALDAGFVVGESLVVADFPAADAVSAPAQRSTPFGTRSGEATRLRTQADGMITLLPTSSSGFFGALSDTASSLSPCRLDDELSIERVD